MFITTAATRWPSPSGTNLQNKTETEMNKKNYNAKPFSIFMSYIAGHKKLFGIDMLCALLVALIDLIFPYVSRYSMKVMLPNKLYATFFTVMAIMVLAYVLKAGLYYVITVIGHKMGVLVESDMRRDVFNHLERLPLTYFDNNKTGTIMSRIVSDLMDISELAHHGPEDLFLSIITIIGAFIMMARIYLPLAVIIVMTLPVMVIYSSHLRLKMSEAFTETRVETGEINANLENSIAGSASPRRTPARISRTNSSIKETNGLSRREAVRIRSWHSSSAVPPLSATFCRSFSTSQAVSSAPMEKSISAISQLLCCTSAFS